MGGAVRTRRHDAPIDGADDAEALRRVARGEVGALGDVYDRHVHALLEFTARAVGRADAEDVVHSVFVRVAKQAGSYDGRAPSARPWLYGIASRVLQERRRSVVRTLRALLRHGAATPAPQTPALDARRDLARGLGALPEGKRVVLLLAEVEGFSCGEIAEMLRIPVGTVWGRLHHARRHLRAFLKEEAT